MSLSAEAPKINPLRMLLIRENKDEHAVEVERGFYIQGIRGAHDQARISFGTPGNEHNYVDIDVDPKTIPPFVDKMSLVEKLALRFKEAARRQTDVDLRFCSGYEDMRRPEHDNLRPDYGRGSEYAP